MNQAIGCSEVIGALQTAYASEIAMFRNSVMCVAMALALGSAVLSTAAFGAPPPRSPIRAGGEPSGSDQTRVGPQSGNVMSPDEERASGHRLTVVETDISAKWEDLQLRMRPEEKIVATCQVDISSCPQPARRFLELVELGRQHEGRARLGEINRAINLLIKPASDWMQHGMVDLWSTPLTTLGAGLGDCEDYAILKYAALRDVGIALEDMRLLIVRAMNGSAHAVLAVRDGGHWLLLDNRTMVLANANDVRHYVYLLILDHRGARPIDAVAFH